MNLLLLLAQTTSTPSSTTPTQTAPSPTDFLRGPMVPLILMIVVFWWIMSRGKNKERNRYEQMLKALKKNDRVQTIGGLLGTVVDVRDNEVVLKVDETSNVKMHFNRTAIKEVLQDASAVETKS